MLVMSIGGVIGQIWEGRRGLCTRGGKSGSPVLVPHLPMLQLGCHHAFWGIWA